MVYIKIFSFLSLVGAVFLSTIFHSAWFVLGWFINMAILARVIHEAKSITDVLVCPFLAYVPIGLLYLMQPWVEKTYSGPGSLIDNPFGFTLLMAFVVILIVSLLPGVASESGDQKKEEPAKEEKNTG